MPVRLLFAEDHELVRAMLTSLLTRAGAEVTAVATGEEAISALEASRAAKPYDAVVTDYEMLPGGKTGIDVALAARRSGQNMPIVILTANDAVTIPAGFPGLALLRKPGGVKDLIPKLTELGVNLGPEAGPAVVERVVE